MNLKCVTLTEDPDRWPELGFSQARYDVILAVPPYRPSDLGLPFCLDARPQRGWPFIRWVRRWLTCSLELLRPSGHFYVYGLPAWIVHFVQPLEKRVNFRYWIAIQTAGKIRRRKLKAEHMALVLFSSPNGRFHCNSIRSPHPICSACGLTLKDYGGHSHLLDPQGCLISDVWKDLEVDPFNETLPKTVLDRALAISLPPEGGSVLILQHEGKKCPALPRAFQLEIPYEKTHAPDASLLNQVHQADILDFLGRLPNNCIDLAFADPPYNLQKLYSSYSDDQAQTRYLAWCESWLAEYRRVLKPRAALFLVNLPKWSLLLARFLSQRLYLQNWIAWDAMAEPLGRILPSHYALLYFTKGPTPNVFNYHGFSPRPGDVLPPDAPIYCLRQKCRRERLELGHRLKTELSDIWTDIHRVRHPKDRDHHPCQLPESLMERIIRLATRPGDVVLDALSGTGTTALLARQLGRQFLAADVDPVYVDMSRRKLSQMQEFGEVPRPSTRRGRSGPVTKRALQLELVRLTQVLGHEPTPEEIQAHSSFPLELYQTTFPVWSKALRAVRVRSRTKES